MKLPSHPTLDLPQRRIHFLLTKIFLPKLILLSNLVIFIESLEFAVLIRSIKSSAGE
jgi:hypothetical protein